MTGKPLVILRGEGGPPTWACTQWGQYEHDWLDCPECIAGYEKTLDEETE